MVSDTSSQTRHSSTASPFVMGASDDAGQWTAEEFWADLDDVAEFLGSHDQEDPVRGYLRNEESQHHRALVDLLVSLGPQINGSWHSSNKVIQLQGRPDFAAQTLLELCVRDAGFTPVVLGDDESHWPVSLPHGAVPVLQASLSTTLLALVHRLHPPVVLWSSPDHPVQRIDVTEFQLGAKFMAHQRLDLNWHKLTAQTAVSLPIEVQQQLLSLAPAQCEHVMLCLAADWRKNQCLGDPAEVIHEHEIITLLPGADAAPLTRRRVLMALQRALVGSGFSVRGFARPQSEEALELIGLPAPVKHAWVEVRELPGSLDQVLFRTPACWEHSQVAAVAHACNAANLLASAGQHAYSITESGLQVVSCYSLALPSAVFDTELQAALADLLGKYSGWLAALPTSDKEGDL